jgi:excisionase family DNA binding protein
LIFELDYAAIADAVAERLQPQKSRWLTKQEAAAHIRCSTRQLERLVRLGEIPHYRPAGRPLFKQEELDEFITNRREV